MKSIVFMFSGQGSQYYQMGKELFVNDRVFKKWIIKLNSIAKQISGISIIDELYSEKKDISEPFTQLKYTHPAIFIVEYAMAQSLLESGIKPDYVMGTSLGEYAAVAVAGILDVEEAMEAVIRQAQTIEAHCSNGGMLAIIHDVSIFYELQLINKNCELTFYNEGSHFIVSGSMKELKLIEEYLKAREISCLRLPVNYGFHSSLIDSAEDRYLNYLATKRYKDTKIPFVSCLYGTQLTYLKEDYLWEVIRKPIKFGEAVSELEREKNGDLIYLDIGPGGTLANNVKRSIKVNSQSESFAIMTPFRQEIKNLSKIKHYVNENYIHNDDVNKSYTKRQEIAYVFPGQGSQVKGMGAELFDEFPEITNKADEILGYSIKELCLKDPNKLLSRTQYTQPALYTVNILSYLKRIKDTGKKPDYLAGHSLGEYSALFSAGAFDFETGLKLVQIRGELMSKVNGGGMTAILGLKENKIEEILHEKGLDTIDVANYNGPTQIVLSGLRDEIEKCAPLFEAEGAIVIPLNVSGAFHSRYMLGVKEKFEKFIYGLTFNELKIPIISNVHARPYEINRVKVNLVDQLTCSVKWTESIRYLMGRGSVVFEEIGPGDVLTKLIDRIQKQAQPLIINHNE